MKPQIPLYLKSEQRRQLETLIRSGDAPARTQTRARILLLTDRWTVRLLTGRLIEMGLVDSVDHTTVWERLKKMRLNPGK